MNDMARTEVLRGLLDHGRDFDTPRLERHAAELGLPLADVFVVAGHPVPGHLLPPDRDKTVMRAFVYRVTYCNHPQLAALREYLLALPDEGTTPRPRPARDPADPNPFPAVLHGLMGNRGFDVREFPFVGLSRSTVRGMLGGAWHQLSQLQAVAGPLGWTLEDLAALAGEPLRPLEHGPMFCHHLGAVFLAAVPRTTEQLVRAAGEADRLSAREDHGAWQPVSQGIYDCPDV
ncbi:hypothetical protein [Actinoplanes aureus]|uniref:Uncharacterized protein n=1 Tax=Actinoplanes aureus TaxID=2792083 RepID=A0A931G0A8_9ACTN|nr:hypothetical protein [Actinoplanes aureus]MBG0565572.1 hypothetical protein [Actinoplanes aureus]